MMKLKTLFRLLAFLLPVLTWLLLAGCTEPVPDETPTEVSPTAAEGVTESEPDAGETALATDAPGTAPSAESGTAAPGTQSATETAASPETAPEAGSDTPTQPDGTPDTEEPTECYTDAPIETEEAWTNPEGAITLPVFDPSTVQSEPMPRLDITTDNGRMIDGSNTDKPVYHSTVSLSNCNEKYVLTNVGAEIHVRGNSTATVSKKPYAIKFDEKQVVLGLGNGKAFKSWCLLADYFDETMMRNMTAFRLGDVLLDGNYYSADCAHVEVYVNGKYQGVYLLCEKTQINGNRIDIDKKEETDTTTLQTGYLLVGQGGIWWEDNYFDIPIGFTVTDRNGGSMKYGSIRFVLSNGDEYSQEQRDYISDYCSAAFNVIYKAIYKNEYYRLSRSGQTVRDTRLTKDKEMTETEKQIACISAVFDLDSAARMCVLDEIAKNLDAMTFNLYVDLSPEGDGRLTLAAPWDFDHAMGKTHYSTTHSTTGWYATTLSASDGIRVNFLTVMLGSTDWFNEMCSEVWKSHYEQIRNTVTEMLVENYRFAEAFERDWDKWGHPTSRGQTGHNTPADEQTFTCHTDSAVFLANWLNKRITWLNIQWGDGEPEDLPVANPDLLKVDFTQASAAAYLTGFNDCEYKLTENGIELTVTGSDPYFSVDYSWLEFTYEAEDFPRVVIYCNCPKTNAAQGYYFEYHMCAGPYAGATSGVKTGFHLDNAPGITRKYETDLAASGFWSGTIHSLRVDFFSGCENGDKIIIKRIELLRPKN